MPDNIDDELNNLCRSVASELAELAGRKADKSMAKVRSMARKLLSRAAHINIAALPPEARARDDENVALALWILLSTEPVFLRRIALDRPLSLHEMYAELAALLNSAPSTVPLKVSLRPPAKSAPVKPKGKKQKGA